MKGKKPVSLRVLTLLFKKKSASSRWELKGHSHLFACQRTQLTNESARGIIMYSNFPPNPGAGILVSREPNTGN